MAQLYNVFLPCHAVPSLLYCSILLQGLYHLAALEQHMCACVQPEGEGKYIWADDSTYEGGWKVTFLIFCMMQLLHQ